MEEITDGFAAPPLPSAPVRRFTGTPESFNALLVPRDVFGLYGLGQVRIGPKGIDFRWHGWLYKARPEHFAWNTITHLTLRDGWFTVVAADKRVGRRAHIWRPNRLRALLQTAGITLEER